MSKKRKAKPPYACTPEGLCEAIQTGRVRDICEWASEHAAEAFGAYGRDSGELCDQYVRLLSALARVALGGKRGAK